MKQVSLFGLLLVTASRAQEPAFKANISLIEVDAVVLGRTGVVDDLKLNDFAIRDNRTPVKVRNIVLEETPLDILMLFETSRLMILHAEEMQTAAEMVMAEFREGDRFGAMSFSEDSRIEVPFTDDLKEAKSRIRLGPARAVFGDGLPSVLAAADASARYIAAQTGPHHRRAVIMFTGDVGGGMKQENHMAVTRALWDDDALLSAIVIPSRLTRFTHDDNPLHFGALSRLSYVMKFSPFDSVDDVVEQTGGETLVYPRDPIRPKIQRMRKRYKLYYDRPAGKPGDRRQIAIELTPAAQAMHPGERIVARKGYVMQ